MPDVALTVPGYDPVRGVVVHPEGEGGDVLIRQGELGVEIVANRAGLRDLARWCLALAAEPFAHGSHGVAVLPEARAISDRASVDVAPSA
jgi:hypothetical protein